MKRNTLILLSILILLSFYLCGCQARILSEDEIISGLPDDIKTVYINYEPRVLDVQSMDIERRRSDDAFDEVYCTLVMEDDGYKSTASVMLTYAYYDQGGWILDDWEVVSSELKPVASLSQAEVDHELSLYYFDNVEFQTQTFDSDSQITYTSYIASYTGANYSYNGSITLVSAFYADHLSGYWVHELQYDNAFEWDIAGTWAAGDDDIRDSTSLYNGSDAFCLYIDMDAITPQNEITFSATAFKTSSSIFSSERWHAYDIVNYCTNMYVLSDRNMDNYYDEPIWRIDFYIDNRDYSVKITPNTIQLLEHDNNIGTLQKGYIIAVSENSYGWPIYTRIPA